MKCYDPNQLPVLVTLAKEFAVCDSWFCSMPGPTWPNRFFVMAGSAGGLDHSPSTWEMFEWETVKGFQFQNGSIFDKNLSWRIYAGGPLRIAQALKGIQVTDVHPFENFHRDVNCHFANYLAQFFARYLA
jgi:phospholipase C